MNREDKNALSRQRILNAALQEFSDNGYSGASLNTVWAKNDISKGAIYHHFKDRDEIYLLCVKLCFDALTACLSDSANTLIGTPGERLQAYFDARIRFFAENPLYLGIFYDAVLQPPAQLRARIAQCRVAFDALNTSVLTKLLSCQRLRPGLSAAAIVDDFTMYMDFFNLHFRCKRSDGQSRESLLKEHEERCHRQLDILLHGVLGD